MYVLAGGGSDNDTMIEIDFETKSYADLMKVGAWVYSEDPTTGVIVLSYLIEDAGEYDTDGIEDWWPGCTHNCAGPNGMPLNLYMAIMLGHSVEAFNAAFEIAIWANVMVKRYGWVPVLPHQWEDVQAAACYLSLPAKLDKLSSALGGPGKDPEGARLITKYSKLYLKTAKKEIPPEDFKKWRAYCADDVAQEAGIGEFLGPLPPRELAVYHMSNEINERGLYLDEAGINAASRIVDQRSAQLTEEFKDLTGYGPNQRDRVMEWLEGHGVLLPNLQKETVLEAIGDPDYCTEEEIVPGVWGTTSLPMSEEARRALEIRVEIAKASTRKLDAMLRNRSADGRARYQTRYHGANTGRWTGSGFQPLNLVRNWEDVDPEDLVADIMHEDAELLDLIYGDAMEAISKASRHWIMAEKGNRILAGDFVSIEAVLLACVAGEEWKVEAFQNREPMYERMGDKIYNLPVGTVTKKTHPAERQDGKTGELAFGYQGALGAWLKFDSSGRHSDERIIEICRAWRKEHPMIVKLWKEYEDCFKYAISHPDEYAEYRGVRFEMNDLWMTIRLLNGKKLWYFKPELRTGMPAWHQPKLKPDCADGTCDCEPTPKITYLSQKEGRWRRVPTYGGKITENVVQAASREILVDAMFRIKEDGRYPIILTVYDEIVCEPQVGMGSEEHFVDLLTEKEDWCADWPINCDPWEGMRYKK